MTRNRLFPLLGLLAVLLASCSPSAVSSNPAVNASASPAALMPTPTPELSTEASVASQAAEATVLPVATSRGPELHATDPATVSLASGGLQFVEFFRFT